MHLRNPFSLLALLVTVSAPLLPAQVRLIAHATAAGTSAPINATGANFIAVCQTNYYVPQKPPTDNAGNTYIQIYTQPNPGFQSPALWATFNPEVSASLKVTVPSGIGVVAAFSGVASVDKTAGAAGGSTPAVQPTNPNELILSCMAAQGATSAATVSPLTLTDYANPGNAGNYAGMGYRVETSATGVSANWASAMSVLIASLYSTQSPAPLKLAFGGLPEGFAGTQYKEQLTATGGAGPLKWSGSVPAGFTLTPSGLLTGRPSRAEALTATITVTDTQGQSASTRPLSFIVAAKPLAIKTTACPGGKQYQPYAGCAIEATGGTPPYAYTWAGQTPWTGHDPPSNGLYSALVEGLNESPTGIISGTVKGEGVYTTLFIATDGAGANASVPIPFNIAGENSMDGCSYPADSIYYQNVSHLPVDTSPAAPIFPGYLNSRIRIGFGQYLTLPNGIPFYKVGPNQPLVRVFTGLSNIPGGRAPVPFDAPMENTRNGTGDAPPIEHWVGDNHVLILQTAGGANHCKEYSLYDLYPNYPDVNGSWGSGVTHPANDTNENDLNGYSAYYADMTKYDLMPQGQPGADAGGLPMIPFLENYDEVLGTGTPGHENGVIKEMKRFTLQHTLRGYVWPATHQAGVGGCTGGFKDPHGNGLISQLDPPTCNMSGPMGEIYRLKASVASPRCAESSPQSRVIIQGFRDHGIILADNGLNGAVIGTPDTRWNMDDLACLGQLKLADFEPVKVQQLAVKWPTSSQVKEGSESAGSPAAAPPTRAAAPIPQNSRQTAGAARR